MEETIPEATNFQYVEQGDFKKPPEKIFLSNFNSYHGSAVARKLVEWKLSEGEAAYEVHGTLQKDSASVSGVKILNPASETFFDAVLSCDLIIFDISQEIMQLSEAQRFLKHFQSLLENSKVSSMKRLILISTIMTWAEIGADSFLTDAAYRKRKPHPCYINHMMLERDLINLQKKFKDHVASLVVCPGIIYGGCQDIFHFLYKKCYFNHDEVEIFAPANNFLPLICLEDFAQIMLLAIRNFRDPQFPYILAVQPENLSAIDIISTLVSAAGGPDTRIRICDREEVFLMKEELMTQRVYNHLTLNIHVESQFLTSFEFTITGFNLQLFGEKLFEEFLSSRKLKPIKILLEGSPFAYQNELAGMLSKFYALHRVQKDCFMENFCTRLKRKIKKAEEYLEDMREKKIQSASPVVFEELILKAKDQLTEWNEKLLSVAEVLKKEVEPEFHEIQDFVMNRLASPGCSKNQGYLMSGFELDSETATFLFSDESGESLDFNLETKPDFVIVLTRTLDQDDLCPDKPIEDIEKLKMIEELKEYYNRQPEEGSLLNYLLDRELIPVEINFDRAQSDSDVNDIFESIKSRIGVPKNYGLSKEEQAEIQRIKEEIARQEALEKAEAERKAAQAAAEEKESQLKEWIDKMMEEKRKEMSEIEQQSLPTRHYLFKYILPNIVDGLKEVAQLRPSNPVEFLGRILMARNKADIAGDEELDEEVVKEFRKLVEETRCDY